MEELNKIRLQLKDKGINIQKLYILECLKNSLNEDITNEELEDLVNEVDYLWLEDENNTCISKICDFVVENKENLQDMDKMEKLIELAEY